MLLAANHDPSSPLSLPFPCASFLCNQTVKERRVSSVRVVYCIEYCHAVFRAQGYHDLEGTPITLFSFIQAVCCLGLYPQT